MVSKVSKTVSFRLPNEVVRAIEARAEATGQTKTAVVMDALAKALGLPKVSQDISLLQRVNALEQRVAALERENNSTPSPDLRQWPPREILKKA